MRNIYHTISEKLAALNIDIFHYEDIVRCYSLAKLNIDHSRKPDYADGIHTAEFTAEASRYQLLSPDVNPYYDNQLSHRETAQPFEISGHEQIRKWELIYLTEGPEGLYIERRGRSSKGCSPSFPKAMEEDLLAEVQRLRAENAYLKIASLGFGRRATPTQKAKVIQKLRREHDWAILLEIAQHKVAQCYCLIAEHCAIFVIRHQTMERLPFG